MFSFSLSLQQIAIIMSPALILGIFVIYTSVIFTITLVTSRKADSQSFFIGNRVSPWFVVAYGMIGASLSGVTFISLPGWVPDTQFTYLLVVLGYVAGYIIIAAVLLPLYYKLGLTSIYSYLGKRFGKWSYKTGSGFFIISRTLVTSLRIYLVINVLQVFVFDIWNVPLWLNASVFVILIFLYTLKGGIKTIIWTDLLQTTFMIMAVILTIILISREIGRPVHVLFSDICNRDLSKIINTDWHNERYFLKQFLAGVFITIAMTGLDQEMMQKNLSCRNLRDARKNMITFSGILVLVNLMFLFLGAFLVLFSETRNINPASGDDLFPTVAMQFLGPVSGLIFIVGLISAAFPSADGALTSLTTSVCIDFLGITGKEEQSPEKSTALRYKVHMVFAIILFASIMIFSTLRNKTVIDNLFTLIGYSYGPLLGLYSFGLFTGRTINDRMTPVIAVLSPLICILLSRFSTVLFNGYSFGFELLLVNGLITYMGLLLFSKRQS